MLLPTVHRDGPYRFFFYSGDGSEPLHVHVEAEGHEAKFWIDPIALASNRGFSPKELRKIERMIDEHRDHLRVAWDGFFNPNP